MKPNCTIVRFDEIGIKASHTRGEFISVLFKQLKKLMPDAKIKLSPYRIIIFSKNPKKSAILASKVFGINSASPAIMVDRDIELIKKVAYSFYKKGKSFRISCQRSDKEYQFNSQEISRMVGEYIFNKGGNVDLINYDLNIGIDFFDKKAFIFCERIQGFGGLPVNSQGKILCLMNNERDYFACLLMMNRGCLPIVVGKNVFYKKLIKNFSYLKISFFKKLKYKNFLGVVSGNNLNNLITDFECPIFYPLAFIDENFVREKFKAMN
ncbi:MAG: THUMP domain-containing protein [Candidatus Nanoarchaeia archaeon]|nr:THUMP domain-containing protein [Candidatus Nanoarchaeia archaeon]